MRDQAGTSQRRGRRGKAYARFLAVASLAAVLPTAGASSAAASVTIGQLAPGAAASPCTGSPFDQVAGIVSSGTSYVVPAAGTVTSWTTNAGVNAGRELKMKVFRKIAEPVTFEVVGHDGPRTLTPSGTAGNTFPTSIPVKPGDRLGLNTANAGLGAAASACAFGGGADILASGAPGDLADGASSPFPFSGTGRLNLTAVVEPTNTFTIGATARNKKKGTATLTLDVPNPGEVTASGSGVKAASAAGAVVATTAPAAGAVQLLIRAKGKKKKKLNQSGKVTLKATITYTPTGGDPSTQSRKLKLKKR